MPLSVFQGFSFKYQEIYLSEKQMTLCDSIKTSQEQQNKSQAEKLDQTLSLREEEEEEEEEVLPVSELQRHEWADWMWQTGLVRSPEHRGNKSRMVVTHTNGTSGSSSYVCPPQCKPRTMTTSGLTWLHTQSGTKVTPLETSRPPDRVCVCVCQ